MVHATATMEACNAWAKGRGLEAHKLEFRVSALGGMGAFATVAVIAGDTLMLLPRGFTVTPYVCEGALQDASLSRSPRAALALFLAHEQACGAASPWAVWLATLPAVGLDGSAFGTSSDLLAAAAARRRGVAGPGAAPADAHSAWMASDTGCEPPSKSYEEEIRACRGQAAATLAFCIGRRPDLAETLPWAIAAVATRAFHVNGVMQLLPLVEKMNHSGQGGRLVVTSAGELALLAGAACAAGDEVFLNYFDGQNASTPERVLAHYGFEPAAAPA